MYLLGGRKQWSNKRLDKASNKTINEVYGEYEQHVLNEKGEETGKFQAYN